MYFKRTLEHQELDLFESKDEAGLVYVRGRRRVGKSWLLKNWVEKKPAMRFYFSGALDSTTVTTLGLFVDQWTQFSGSLTLSDLKRERLNWNTVFAHICDYAKKSHQKITLVLDEIQWIAKQGSGFIGALKSAWVDFERSKKVNLIVCGSSNRFFSTHVGGEEKILRGLQTRSILWVHPVTLRTTQAAFLKNWTKKEIATTYMFVGGIPYYLNQLQEKEGFIHAINKAMLSAETIFLSEVDEILSLEFNKAGIKTVKKILKVMAVHGATQAEIRKKTNIPSSTLSEITTRLLDYEIIYQENNFLQPNPREPKYKINDFYLNFYFFFLERLATLIKRNLNGEDLIITQKILKHKGFYIEGFSGYAFEHLFRYCLHQSPVNKRLMTLLMLGDQNFELFTCKTAAAQIDCLIAETEDRIIRVIECKWGSHKTEWIDQLVAKPLPLPEHHTRMNVLVVDEKPTQAWIKHAQKNAVKIITIHDLWAA